MFPFYTIFFIRCTCSFQRILHHYNVVALWQIYTMRGHAVRYSKGEQTFLCETICCVLVLLIQLFKAGGVTSVKPLSLR